MTHPITPAAALKDARLKAGETQLSLATRIRERFAHVPGRKTSRITISRIENGHEDPEPVTWSRVRAVLPSLPELPA